MLKILLGYAALTLLCLSSFSCSFIRPTPDSLNNDIDQWLAENQHDKIDYAIKSIEKDKTPGFKKVLKRKSSIKSKKINFIEKTSKTAKKYKAEFKWQKALDTYNNALGKIANQPRLIKERETLIEQRNNHVTNLRKELLINRANALISYNKTYTTLQQLLPDDRSARYDINQYEEEKEELASELQKCGEQAIKNNHYAVARDCYVLSNKLMPSESKLSFVDTIKKQLKSQENEQRFKELLSAYETAYNKKDYKNARTALQTLIAIDPKHSKAKKLLSTLNTEINALVESIISTGKDQYSKKEINEALKTWQQAKKLSPDNKELTQLIIRAEKVSKKLQKLEHDQ